MTSPADRPGITRIESTAVQKILDVRDVVLYPISIMPDHVHGIIKIVGDVLVETPKLGVSTIPKKRKTLGLLSNNQKEYPQSILHTKILVVFP